MKFYYLSQLLNFTLSYAAVSVDSDVHGDAGGNCVADVVVVVSVEDNVFFMTVAVVFRMSTSTIMMTFVTRRMVMVCERIGRSRSASRMLLKLLCNSRACCLAHSITAVRSRPLSKRIREGGCMVGGARAPIVATLRPPSFGAQYSTP